MKAAWIKFGCLSLVLLSGCGIDLQTKDWAMENLRYYQTREVIPQFFELRYAENTGVAFSFLQGISEKVRIPLIFSGVILATLMVLFLSWQWRKERFGILLPLALILSGAFGNFINRLNYGYVVDFFHFHYDYAYSFPIFNVADILIFVGVSLMIIHYYKGHLNWPEPKSTDQPTSDTKAQTAGDSS